MSGRGASMGGGTGGAAERGALVTGGAGTLGRAIGAALAAEGWSVTLCDRDAGVAAAAQAIGATAHACDITDRAAREDMVAAVEGLALLVNCAGLGAVVPFEETDEALWDRVIAVNLTAAMFLSQAAAKRMASGAIVNIASVSGVRAGVGRAAYGVSKAGLIQLTRQMAVELAPRIRVNAVAPGPVDGPLARNTHPPDQVADFLRSIPQGRYAEPEEVADAVAFLASPRASHVNGHCLAVDGGFLAAGVGLSGRRNHAA